MTIATLIFCRILYVIIIKLLVTLKWPAVSGDGNLRKEVTGGASARGMNAYLLIACWELLARTH